MRLSVLFALVSFVEISLCFDLGDLTFKGRGKRDSPLLTSNYKYQFSSGLQDDICDDKEDTNCWMTQGISKWSQYITRSAYQKPYNTEDDYTLLIIGKRGSKTLKYSNVLIQSGYCHAGDNVIREIDDVFWFFIVCGSKSGTSVGMIIFSENDIEDRSSDNLTVPTMGIDKEYSYFVNKTNIRYRNLMEDGQYVDCFQYLSRYNGDNEDEYVCGRYDNENDDTDGSNLRRIKIDHNNNWEISTVTKYKLTFTDTPELQGAVMINGDMYLVNNKFIYRCNIADDDSLTNCIAQCHFLSLCGLVCQGAETDSNGDLYVGTEYGNKDGSWGTCGHPFWEINNVKNDHGNCYSDADPYNDIEEPNQLPTNDVEFRFDYQTIGFILLVIATIFTTGMSCYVYCSGKKVKNVRYQSVKVVSDSDV